MKIGIFYAGTPQTEQLLAPSRSMLGVDGEVGFGAHAVESVRKRRVDGELQIN